MPLRCKYGNNILHLRSKLLMYTVHKAAVSPFKSGYLEGMKLMAAAVIKGARPSRPAPLEADDSLRCSEAAAYVPHWLFTLLQVHRCSC